jgi:hypothetical protein
MYAAPLPAGARHGGGDCGDQPGWASEITSTTRTGRGRPGRGRTPAIRPGYVCCEVLDHTFVLKLLEENWNLPALTARDAAAVSPLGALDLTGPPAFLEPRPGPNLA